MSKVLHAKGLISSPDPKPVDEAFIDGSLKSWGFPGLGWYMFGNNSRAKAGRAAEQLGWKSMGEGLWEGIEGDVELALETKNSGVPAMSKVFVARTEAGR